MRVVASGVVYDGATAPPYGRRSIRRTTVCRAGDGTLYVSFRRGTDHESIDGHPITLASTDDGTTWEIRYDGYGQGALDGTPGQFMSLAWYETEPGVLMGTALWIDHSDPTLPFMNPETEGLLPEKIVLAVSTDGARTWDSRQVMDTSPHRAPVAVREPRAQACQRGPDPAVRDPQGVARSLAARPARLPAHLARRRPNLAGLGGGRQPPRAAPATTGTSGWRCIPATGA